MNPSGSSASLGEMGCSGMQVENHLIPFALEQPLPHHPPALSLTRAEQFLDAFSPMVYPHAAQQRTPKPGISRYRTPALRHSSGPLWPHKKWVFFFPPLFVSHQLHLPDSPPEGSAVLCGISTRCHGNDNVTTRGRWLGVGREQQETVSMQISVAIKGQ